MRSFAPAQFHIQHFGLWRGALTLLLLLALAGLAAWRFAQPGQVDNLPWLLLSAAAIALVGSMPALLNPVPVSLRWDARCWHLGPAHSVGSEPESGDVNVAIDLGSWMLLRFRTDQPAAGRRTVWLPVQRLGMQTQWHALRCAVHSPRPANGLDAAPDA